MTLPLILLCKINRRRRKIVFVAIAMQCSALLGGSMTLPYNSHDFSFTDLNCLTQFGKPARFAAGDKYLSFRDLI